MKKVFLAVFALALVGTGIWRFSVQAQAHTNAEKVSGPPSMRVTTVTAANKDAEVWLPGTVAPRFQVTLYARSNGFLKQWLVDLGDTVKKDQVLARIEAPDLSASLSTTNARLIQAKASLALIKSQHERVVALSSSGNLSAQDVDTSALRLQAAESELALAVAEHDRLAALVSYLTVKAPFDGTINRRMVENGALVTAGTTALFDIATTGTLRVDVDVPQWAAAQMKVGLEAVVTAGTRKSKATVSRLAGSLDPVLRTLHVQLTPDDGEALLSSGSYVRVKFDIPREDPVLKVPASAIAVRSGQTVVAQIAADNTIHFTPVKILRELGRDTEVLTSLEASTRIALFPPASMADGDAVTPVEGENKGVTQAPAK